MSILHVGSYDFFVSLTKSCTCFFEFTGELLHFTDELLDNFIFPSRKMLANCKCVIALCEFTFGVSVSVSVYPGVNSGFR